MMMKQRPPLKESQIGEAQVIFFSHVTSSSRACHWHSFFGNKFLIQWQEFEYQKKTAAMCQLLIWCLLVWYASSKRSNMSEYLKHQSPLFFNIYDFYITLRISYRYCFVVLEDRENGWKVKIHHAQKSTYRIIIKQNFFFISSLSKSPSLLTTNK